MSSGLGLKSEPARILACTVSQDVHQFDLLIEDMEAELGEAWGDLTFQEARAFLDQPESADLEFLAIAVTAETALDMGLVGELIMAAKARRVRSILVVHDIGPAALHELLRLGADDFVPYPLGDGALHDAIARVRGAQPAVVSTAASAMQDEPKPKRDSSAPTDIAPRMDGGAAVFAVQGLSGGTGASTLAVNLAWELANVDKQKAPSVCLMDLDLQVGTVSTYLDLPRRDMIIDLLQDAKNMDVEAFKQALLGYENKLSIFPAPPEVLPLDIIGPEEVEALLALATACFDIVVIDMPHTLVMWTETVLKRADVYFATMELDMRSAQNVMRFLNALRSEDISTDKLNFVLNRAPGLTDLSGKARVKKLADSLGVTIAAQLPDGGRQVMQAGDHGQPLMDCAKKNALRKEIAKLAAKLHKAMSSAEAAQ